MSWSINPVPVAGLPACACGACAACAARSALRAVPAADGAERPGPARGDSYESSGQAPTDAASPTTPSASDQSTSDPAHEPGDESAFSQELTDDERRMVTELQARDLEVRAHEAAHQAAGGGAVGGASYSYQQGPDGRQYAIGGEVSVDLSTSGASPEAIIAKMARVRAAAMAPANPSAQDFAVAAAAGAIEAAARVEQRAKVEETTANSDETDATAETDAENSTAELPMSESSAAESSLFPRSDIASTSAPSPVDRSVQRALGSYRTDTAEMQEMQGAGFDQRA